jgi:murein DD-endopeptidase MepM/ murein hydrolase activator NlpD
MSQSTKIAVCIVLILLSIVTSAFAIFPSLWNVPVRVKVGSPSPDFELSADPFSQKVPQGGTATYTITVASINGFSQPVQLSLSELPLGVTATLNPEQVTPPQDSSATSTLTVYVSDTATLGSYTLTVTGNSDTITHSVNISLEITATVETPIADSFVFPVQPVNEWTIYEGGEFGFYREWASGYHSGEDWNRIDGNDLGEPVYAVANGIVTHIDNQAKSLVIKHTAPEGSYFRIPGKDATTNRGTSYSYPEEYVSAIYSVYIHIDISPHITKETIVNQGDVIGHIIDPGGGPHLHFEIRHPEAQHSAKGSMLLPVSNWAPYGTIDTNGHYLNMQTLVDSGARDPSDFINANLKVTENQPPVADAGLDQSVFSGDFVIFNGSKSNDHDGTIVSYRWDFGDGTTEEGRIVSHRFRGAQNGPKTYTVTLTVEDDEGATATDTVSVTVTPLERSVEISESPIFARMTVTYNWIEKAEGEDVYIISKIHVEAKGFVGVFVPAIWVWRYDPFLGEIPDIDFLDYRFVFLGEAKDVYEPPFETKPIIGVNPPVARRTFEEGAFEGIEVRGTDVMSIYVQGYKPEAGLLPIGVELFEFSSNHFVPGAPPVEPSLIQQLLNMLLDELADLLMGKLDSPGELRVYDAEGRVTGLVNGEIVEEIPNSAYYNNTVMVLFPNSTYYFEVVGTEEGSYRLFVASLEQGESYNFTATDIPISVKTIHQYTIDWEALVAGGEGVTVKVDSEGDGTFERTFTADSELTQHEFELQARSVEALPMWVLGVAIVVISTATIIAGAFLKKRRQYAKG